MEYNTDLYSSKEKAVPPQQMKIIYPKLNQSLDILQHLVSINFNQLFETDLYYNFILLFDSDLSVVSYCINKDLMLSKIKICQGLNFQEENMGKTSVSECYKFKKTTVMLPDKIESPFIGDMANCTVPITLNNDSIAYISAFFLSSKYDRMSIKIFTMLADIIINNFKLLRTTNDIEDYVLNAIRPGFNTEVLGKAEKEVLNYMKMGCTNKDISNHLYISENTVGFHSKLIKEKLSCSNRTEVAVNTVFYEILEILRKYT